MERKHTTRQALGNISRACGQSTHWDPQLVACPLSLSILQLYPAWQRASCAWVWRAKLWLPPLPTNRSPWANSRHLPWGPPSGVIPGRIADRPGRGLGFWGKDTQGLGYEWAPPPWLCRFFSWRMAQWGPLKHKVQSRGLGSLQMRAELHIALGCMLRITSGV